jgi:hypothetical protein
MKFNYSAAIVDVTLAQQSFESAASNWSRNYAEPQDPLRRLANQLP